LVLRELSATTKAKVKIPCWLIIEKIHGYLIMLLIIYRLIIEFLNLRKKKKNYPPSILAIVELTRPLRVEY